MGTVIRRGLSGPVGRGEALLCGGNPATLELVSRLVGGDLVFPGPHAGDRIERAVTSAFARITA